MSAYDCSIHSNVKIKSNKIETTQVTYAKRLSENYCEAPSSHNNLQPLSNNNRKNLKHLFFKVRQQDKLNKKSQHDSKSDPMNDYYLQLLMSQIENSANTNIGWGYTANNKELPSLLVGGVWYTGWELPLTGTQCAMVYDIVVQAEQRNLGIATSLQSFAYKHLKSEGVNWVAANIELDNRASVRQAEKVGQRPWALNIKVTSL